VFRDVRPVDRRRDRTEDAPVPADRQDLAARLAATTPADTVRGLIFSAAFDVARQHGDEALAVGADPARKGKRADFLSYPARDYLELAWNLADRLEEQLGGIDGVFFELGYRALANVMGSMLGHTILTFGRTPRTLLGQVPSGYRATVSYGERRLTWEGERRARIDFERDFLVPPFHCGVLTALLDAVGAQRPSVTGRQVGFLAARYDVSWDGESAGPGSSR